MNTIRVAVIEEHAIFRRGLVACLRDDPLVEVVGESDSGQIEEDVDVAVISPLVASVECFRCPIIICGEELTSPVVETNQVFAVVPRSTTTVEQLLATVRAVAAGLQVVAPRQHGSRSQLDERSYEVLRLLAQGADTREISVSLSYSERTVKGLIQSIERELGARSRAQAVAEGIRRGLVAGADPFVQIGSPG